MFCVLHISTANIIIITTMIVIIATLKRRFPCYEGWLWYGASPTPRSCVCFYQLCKFLGHCLVYIATFSLVFLLPLILFLQNIEHTSSLCHHFFPRAKTCFTALPNLATDVLSCVSWAPVCHIWWRYTNFYI